MIHLHVALLLDCRIEVKDCKCKECVPQWGKAFGIRENSCEGDGLGARPAHPMSMNVLIPFIPLCFSRFKRLKKNKSCFRSFEHVVLGQSRAQKKNKDPQILTYPRLMFPWIPFSKHDRCASMSPARRSPSRPQGPQTFGGICWLGVSNVHLVYPHFH